MRKNKILFGLAGLVLLFSRCRNQDVVYPDFPYQTVYFANQYPVRTVELGDDEFVDNSLDNQHKISIKATIGGTRDNKKNITVDFHVDESLCNGLIFNGPNNKVMPMPSSYYHLASNQITILPGNILGGVEVQLTDDFFADPNALSNTYVIPLVMTKATGVDSILQGKALVANPNRCVDANWSVKPKDFVLYAVKYVNPWHGNYLRRGTDQITKADGSASTAVRHSQYVENNPVMALTTSSMKTVSMPLTVTNSSGQAVTYTLILTFNTDGTCTVTSTSASLDVAGTGKFVSKGEKNSFGGQDRDGLYLDYTVNFKDLNFKYATKDTLVLRDRGVKPEYFTVTKL